MRPFRGQIDTLAVAGGGDVSSRIVTSSQRGPHPNLRRLIQRYRTAAFRRPLAEHTSRVFERCRQLLVSVPRPLVLDAGCGTGQSTARVAASQPDHWVIGVDRSAKRLGRSGVTEQLLRRANMLLVQAELVDWLRLAAATGWRFERLLLLYPNPYPKPGQLQRRWHAHPVFPLMLALSDHIELRSNWRLYAEEFCLALAQFQVDAEVVEFEPASPLTPFERKYASSGHPLYRVTAKLARGNDNPYTEL